MSGAALFIIVGLSFGLYYSLGINGKFSMDSEENIHKIIGFVAVGLFIIQFLMGVIQSKAAKAKPVIRIIHFFIGLITYLIARKFFLFFVI